MVRGTSDIFHWYERTEMPYWRIYGHKGISSGNFILQSSMEQDQTVGDALADLKTKIAALHRGTFTLVAFGEPNKLPTKGYMFTDIEITTEGSAAGVSQVAGVSSIGDVEKLVREGIDKYKREQELDMLRKKVQQLEKDNRDYEKAAGEPINKILNVIAPHADKIIGGIFPQVLLPATAVAGTPDAGPEDNDLTEATTEVVEMNEEEREIVSDFLTVVASLDPEWPDTLRRLTQKLKAQPQMLGMVKTFI